MAERELVFERYIEAAPSTVWEFWVDPARMIEWWGAHAELQPVPGGVFRVEMATDGPIMDGTYVELEPHKRLVFRFGWRQGQPVPANSTRVEVDLEPEGTGTLLRLRHILPDDAADAHNEGWTHFLAILVDVAAGR